MSDTSISSELALSGDLHRYPGVRSFHEADSRRFFGRHRAAEELLLRVLSVRLLLQFAPSGAGKTSVLNAGLFPRIRQYGYLPCSVRLNQPNESLVDAVGRSLREAARTSTGLKDPVVPETAPDVWSLLANAQLWSYDLRVLTPVLVFDQFEEVFTLRDEAFRRTFATEIGALSRGQRAAAAPGAPASLPPDVKIIISLREEYLGALEEMASAIPDLFRERLRLSPLTHEEAKEAMVEPARLAGDWSSPEFSFTDTCLEGLLDFIDGVSDRVRVIEPLTLQLVCRKAEEIATTRAKALPEAPALTLEDFGGAAGLEHLVHHYYVGELAKLGDRQTRGRAAEMFERGLLDPSGKRLMLEQGEIQRVYRVELPTLDALVESRLLRREPRNESVFYEISHDRLTDVIARHRGTRLPWWVAPALGAAAVLIAVLFVSLLMILQAKNAAEQSQRRTSQALDVLFGDELGLRLREAGLSDTLAQVLEKAPPDQGADALARIRRLRREGEMAWERGTLAAAEQKFTAALEVVDAAGGGPREVRDAERALILKWIGDVRADQFKISEAATRYREAVQIWESLGTTLSATNRLNAIEARLVLAAATERLGDEAGAETQFADATKATLQMVLDAYHRTFAPNPDPFAFGRAVQVHADAMLYLARVWRRPSDLRGARAVAAELIRLRPLSAQARIQLGTASAIYGAAVVNENWQDARRLFDESDRQFRELAQFDPRNRRMYRERAAVQLLTAQGFGLCAKAPECRKQLRPGELESAETAARDSTGRFEVLAAEDPDNTSFRADIAWGKEVQADLRRERKAAGSLLLLDEALAVRDSLTVDPNDLFTLSEHVTVQHTKARVLLEQGQSAQALALADRALAEGERLPHELWRRSRTIEGLELKAEILTKLKRTAESAAASAQSMKLRGTGDDPTAVRSSQALKLWKEGSEISRQASLQTGAERRRQHGASAAKFREALDSDPGDPNVWAWLRLACQGENTGLVDTNGQMSSEDSGDKKLAEANLRCQVQSSWMAWVLSDNATTEADRKAQLRTLYVDRRSLAMFLRYDQAQELEALAIAEQGVRDTEAMFAVEPSVEVLDLVADAHYGLGLMRNDTRHAGWEDAMRVALVRGEQRQAMQPKKSAHATWLGNVRGELAKRLAAANRSAAANEERQQAQRDCQNALRLAQSPGEREDAQACLDDLAQ